MAQTFEDITRNVVDHFLQNILFIDDNAYSDSKENAFNAQEISSVFSQKGKLCTIYAPSTTKDLKNCFPLFAKSDVVVLDWYLDLINEQAVDAEADAETEEPRGVYTVELIKNIIEDAADKKMKLVVVYTGETDLIGISDDIYNLVEQYGNYTKDDCYIYSSNMVIVVRAKYNGIEQYKHIEDLKNKVIKYEDLPSFIVNVFANHVKGLVSNFALYAISIIRENTSRILNVYSKELDIAYLGHRMVLPNPENAKGLLVKLFGESITDLIASLNIDTHDWLQLWINEKYPQPKTIKITDNKNIQVDQNILKRILSNHFDDFEKHIKTFFDTLSNNDAKLIHKNAALLLDENIDIIKNANLLFAKLTHHKNVFLPQKENPFLTLGTIVHSTNTNNYYLCIQQRCDSLRIDGIRKFLFLPLVENGGDTHVLVTNDKQLQVAKSSYDIKTIKFEADENKRCVCSKRVKDEMLKIDKFVFTSIHGEEYIWVLELKELHAQRIVDAYCSQLSRVGIDESEWLRLL